MAQIDDVTSKGLQRYAHYTSSRVSSQLWEPLYKNLFTVTLTPPDAMKDIYGSSDTDGDVNYILEGVLSVSGINPLPGVADTVTLTYKWAVRSFAGSKPATTVMDLDIKFSWNLLTDETGTVSNYTYKFFRMWFDIIWDPLTGRMGLKRDYAADKMVVTMQDRAGVPYHLWILYNIFPTGGLPLFDFDYSLGSAIYDGNVKFRCDYWDESII